MEYVVLLPIMIFMIGVIVWLWRLGRKKNMPVSDGRQSFIISEDIRFFERMLSDGYTEVAFSVAPGPWIEIVKKIQSVRIVGMWAFFHPDGNVLTFEWQERLKDENSHRLPPYSNNYTTQSFAERLETYGVRLESRISLPMQIRVFQGKMVPEALLHFRKT